MVERDIRSHFCNDRFLIYEDETRHTIDAYIRYNMNDAFGSFPFLNTIVVSEDYIGKGIGKGLLYEMEKDVYAEKWSTKIFLTVAAANKRAYDFYSGYGYMAIGTIENMFRKDVDEILMYKVIRG